MVPNPNLPAWLNDAISQSGRIYQAQEYLSDRERTRHHFSITPTPNPFSITSGRAALNLPQNRYTDIAPYDANRVLLPASASGGDYINASWIDEACWKTLDPTLRWRPRSWIAAQGPLEGTVYDFLSMFLDSPGSKDERRRQRPRCIVKLTACYEDNGNEKSYPYIPSAMDRVCSFPPVVWDREAGGFVDVPGRARITVRWLSTAVDHHHCIASNRLRISRGDEEWVDVTQLDCVAWPDHGAPGAVEPILKLIEEAEEANSREGRRRWEIYEESQREEDMAPIVVHCSAGVGRTGTLIAIASLRHALPALQAGRLEKLNHCSPLGPLPKELEPDLVAHVVDHLRDQRVSMVQSTSQLVFIYKALAHMWT